MEETMKRNGLQLNRTDVLKMLATLLVPLLIVIFRPLGLTVSQSIVLASLLLTVTWWAVGNVRRDLASIFLLVSFIIFGNTAVRKIFFFPLSSDFITIIAAFILSEGIVNSKAADRFSQFVLYRYCSNSRRLVLMSFLLGILFIFVIPQPFPRGIIIASIYASFLKNQSIGEEERKIVLMSVFVASTATCMMFLNGDVILNYAALNFAKVSMLQSDWMKFMLVPAGITSFLIFIAYVLTFRGELKTDFNFGQEEKTPVSRDEIVAIAIMLGVVGLWMTESLHGVSSALIALAGVAAMKIFGILEWGDLKKINVGLLLFLTAAFAIGRVLTGSGVAAVLTDFFLLYFPAPTSVMYFPFILFLIVVVHMFFGSTITALSILIPSLVGLTQGILDPQMVALMSYAAVSIQYLLPFHHVTVLVGFGNDYFDTNQIVRFGLVLTLMLPLVIFGIFFTWWRFVGLY